MMLRKEGSVSGRVFFFPQKGKAVGAAHLQHCWSGARMDISSCECLPKLGEKPIGMASGHAQCAPTQPSVP